MKQRNKTNKSVENLQIHIQKSVTQLKCTFHKFHQNFFLVALGGLTWKIFFSERERESERERVSERECIHARKFNGNGKWLNSKT